MQTVLQTSSRINTREDRAGVLNAFGNARALVAGMDEPLLLFFLP